MYRVLLLTLAVLFSSAAIADTSNDSDDVKRAVLDYIESQHNVEPDLMKRGLDKELAKRTYWKSKDGSEFIMETDFETMVWVAENYNKDGDKFPSSPKIDIDILDIDKRVASVKLTADDWIDYMHLYKNENKEWKILNVLWQYNDTQRHSSKK
ncbi:nuclear transport factor 2 family protein [Shewanella gelidimarina]|uniref:nuclear transport factor 2 family protein n=1 Tax=Shewanella gelidimarina TaxID=56813 RepID=UPI00200F665F|nr:nuclear transport factor 2 family protein [Shewanella gelidimarina]MCL1057585.1 nuclear transport factor 2 family protein [Shewanella gelidimarina]